MTLDFQIATYSTRLPFDQKHGLCKVCNTKVYWGRSRVLSHKSRNCKGMSEAERLLFRNKRIISNDPESGEYSSTSSYIPASKKVMNCIVDKFTAGERDVITKNIQKGGH